MAYFEENKLCIVTIVTCDVIDAPINTETITETLWTLQAIRWFLFGPNRTSGSRDMAFFESKICIL